MAVTASVVACVVAAAMDSVYWPFEAIYLAAGIAYLAAIRM